MSETREDRRNKFDQDCTIVTRSRTKSVSTHEPNERRKNTDDDNSPTRKRKKNGISGELISSSGIVQKSVPKRNVNNAPELNVNSEMITDVFERSEKSIVNKNGNSDRNNNHEVKSFISTVGDTSEALSKISIHGDQTNEVFSKVAKQTQKPEETQSPVDSNYISSGVRRSQRLTLKRNFTVASKISRSVASKFLEKRTDEFDHMDFTPTIVNSVANDENATMENDQPGDKNSKSILKRKRNVQFRSPVCSIFDISSASISPFSNMITKKSLRSFKLNDSNVDSSNVPDQSSNTCNGISTADSHPVSDMSTSKSLGKSTGFPKIAFKPKNHAFNTTKAEPPNKFSKFDAYFNEQLYGFLSSKMESKYGSLTSDEVKKLTNYIDEVVQKIIQANDNHLLHDLKVTLFRENIIITHYDFYLFCMDYLPSKFRQKSVPMMQPLNKPLNADFNPETLWCAIE